LTWVILVCGLASCAAAQEHRPRRPAWTTQDSWFQPTSIGMAWLQATATERAKWTWIEHDQIFQITGPRAASAEARLQKAPVVKLTLAEAEELAGKRLAPPPGKTPHLVRSVYLIEGTGRFSVGYRDNLLVVNHGSLGSNPVPMKRRSLIVFLPLTPTDVFVECWMAE
jgi:hypothetical protein